MRFGDFGKEGLHVNHVKRGEFTTMIAFQRIN